MGASFKGQTLPEQPVVAEHLSMIGHKHQHRIRSVQSVGEHGVINPADFVVDLGHGSVIPHPCHSLQIGIGRTGFAVENVTFPFQPKGIIPVAGFGRSQGLSAVHGPERFRCIERRMGTDVGQRQEEGLVAVAFSQKIQSAVSHPSCGMVFFLVDPRTSNPGIAFHAGFGGIRIGTELLLQPVLIIIGDFLIFKIRCVVPAVVVEESVVKIHRVIANAVPERVNVQLPGTVALISCIRKS